MRFLKKKIKIILKKQGCPLCSKPSKLTTNLFKGALLIHNNKYDYSLVNTLIKNNKIYNIENKTFFFEKRKFNIVEFIHGRNRDYFKTRNRRVKRKK
jgi:hypothetical protein